MQVPKLVHTSDEETLKKINLLTHSGRVTHICVRKLTTTGSDSSLSPNRCQAITWTKAGTFLIGPLGTNFSEILIKTYTLSFKKINFKMSSGEWQPSCLGLNVLRPNDCSVPQSGQHFQVTCLASSHYLNQCWQNVPRNTLQLNLN